MLFIIDPLKILVIIKVITLHISHKEIPHKISISLKIEKKFLKNNNRANNLKIKN